MKGLEISELKYSELERTVRIDSEFYSKINIAFEQTIQHTKPRSLADFVRVRDGNHLSIGEHYSEEGIPYYRGGDIYNFYIEQTANPLRIPERIFNTGNMKRSHLKKGDVLVSIVGAIIGNLSLVKTNAKATCSCKLAILRPENINPELLAIFFKSKFGQNQIQKFRRGTGQTGLILEDFDQILIPEFRVDFSRQIESLVNDGFAKLEESIETYTQAEQLLLQELGLENFTPSQEAVNVKSFAESFGQTGRLDAEYYQVKYDRIEKAFDAFDRIRLADLVKYPISSGTTPKAGGDDYTDETDGIPFIRAVDLQNGEVTTSNFNYIKTEVHNGVLKKTHLKENDLLFSIAGTVGRAALFKHSFEANINQAVSILRFDETRVKRLYLVAFFNTDLGKEFVSKYSRQGVQTNLNLSEVGDLSIPIIDFKKQEQIAELIEQSFALKKQSEHLLELAKQAVEMAIEKSEEEAMAFIDRETK